MRKRKMRDSRERIERRRTKSEERIGRGCN
jgi:hypothetical protein